ncbi:class I SAM-dependent methyltransferase [Thermomonas sp. HDW16]|uniref:class I SAM-dependent methyltransferase n=1 Tax=Thermomonas sp. HDW16 TaxID=2714945 RepID=UPI00140B3159|nr:class I SAM-dependent methyltransferase [Thermomonas sp. HDW16]QIL20516.1 class I SAM-dependent methyltransferase [Thermomonas sp. HDW16]
MSTGEYAVAGLHDHIVGTQLAAKTDKTRGVLDIGCGSGAFLRRLQVLGFENLCGVDINPPGQIDEGIEYIKHDLDDVSDPLYGRTFDIITMIELIEHLDSIGVGLRMAARHLASDGKILITTPNIESLNARVRFLFSGDIPFFDKKSDPTHLFPVRRTSLERLAESVGLIVESETWFPQVGSDSKCFSPKIRVLSRVLALIIPDLRPGDISIYTLRHA